MFIYSHPFETYRVSRASSSKTFPLTVVCYSSRISLARSRTRQFRLTLTYVIFDPILPAIKCVDLSVSRTDVRNLDGTRPSLF